MTDCTVSPLNSRPAPQPDATIFAAWRTVVEEVTAINSDNGESDEIGDARFERAEAARETIALTSASTLAGLATKVRCMLHDMLVNEGVGDTTRRALEAGELPDPADINDVALRHLSHLLIQLECAHASQAAVVSAEMTGLRRLHREIQNASRAWNAATKDVEKGDPICRAYYVACDAFIDAPARTPKGIAYKLKMMVKAGDDWGNCEGVVGNLIADLGKLNGWPVLPSGRAAGPAALADAARKLAQPEAVS